MNNISNYLFAVILFLPINSDPIIDFKSKNINRKNENRISSCTSNRNGGGGGGSGGIGGDGGTKNYLAGGTHIFGTNIILAIDPDSMKKMNFEEIMGKRRKNFRNRPSTPNNNQNRFSLKSSKSHTDNSNQKFEDIVVHHISFKDNV